MPKWVNAAETSPVKKSIAQYNEYVGYAYVDGDRIIFDYCEDSVSFFVGALELAKLKWLDEEEISFTLADMRASWDICDTEHADRSGCSLPHGLFEMFISDKYKINL